MSPIERLRVDLGPRSYEILIGADYLADAGDLLRPLKLGQRGVIVADSNTAGLFAEPLRQALHRDGYETEVLTVAAGESSKSMRQVERLLERLPALGLDRHSFVIAVGGGVVGDLAGFLAAVYLRGIAFIQVPTSLLAQVDSSVGGKTGVNLPQGKNLVGAFYQPRLVLIDTATLRSLPPRELRAGFAEVIKYGAIRDRSLFAWLEANAERVLKLEPDAVTDVVKRCCQLKAEVVGLDERESGVRAILNFGHTVGHAVEALTEYVGLLHGEAVAMGMCVAARLSVQHGGLSAADALRLEQLIAASGLPVRLGDRLKLDDLREAMKLDKKARAGKPRFVLLRRLGEAFVSDAVTDADLEEVLRVCR
jgi:3-dehydroquinate synthase